MPEFEEENATSSQSQSYTPSIDASKKPRTRRRSGGFKTEVASLSNAKMGEVTASDALKEEKLSGKPSAAAREPRSQREDKPRRERSERKPREPRGERKPREASSEREPRQKQKREPRAARTDANPQPSAETLAAIASVEAKIAARRAEREARRAERDKNRPAKGERPERPERTERKPSAKRESKQQAAPQKKGLLASILSIFGLGAKEEPAPKPSGNRGNQNRSGRSQGSQGSQGKSGNRGGQNRGRSQGKGKGGNRGGQNRKRGGKGPRKSDRRSNEKVES